MQGRTMLASLALVLLLAGCGGEERPLPVVEELDLERYSGLWYEVARLPQFFQRGCFDSTAEYRLNSNGTVAVENRCQRSGGTRSATGTARVVDPAQPAILKVRFDTWINRVLPRTAEGDYWVIYLDDDYNQAMVGAPNRKYLWLLARTPDISDRQYATLVARARELGFPVEELVRNRDLRPQ